MPNLNRNPILTHDDLNREVRQVAEEFLAGEHVLFEYHPTGHEKVCATVENMESIPAGANPFCHDDFSMGTDLTRDWKVMHPGFDRAEEPSALQWIYLVNLRTGQRIKINLEHTPTSEQFEQQKAAWKEKNHE